MDIDFGYLIFQYLFISGVYGAAVGIIILIARQILKNKISKKYLCAIWLIFIFKLIIPYGLASDFSLFNKIPLLKDNTYITFDNIFYKADDNEVYGVDNLNNYEDLGKNKAIENTQNNKENSYKNFEDNIISNNNNTYYDEEEMSRFDVVDFIIVVEILMILVYMFVYFKFNKKLILYQQKSNRLEKIFKDTLKKMDINKKIELIITDSVNSPSLIGIFKIKVLIPSNLIDLEDFQLEYIFLHELCHYKRKDNIINYLLVVLQCLHLTNIVVWILFKKIRNDIELACDEKVLSILNEEDHDKYGLTILDVLEKINSNNKMIVGLSMISDKKVIKSRLEIIKKFKHLEHKKILALAGIASILVLGSALLTNNRIIADQKVLEGRYVNQLLEHKANYIKSKHEIEFLLHDINCTHNNYGNCSIGLYPINSIKFIDKKDHSSFMIDYETNYVDLYDMENNLYKNSAIIFSLIKNLKEIDYSVRLKDDSNIRAEDRNQYKFNFKREDIEEKLGIKLNEIEEDKYYEFLIDLSSSIDGEPSLNDAIEKYLYNKSSLLSEEGFYSFDLEEDEFIEYPEFETTSYAIIGKHENGRNVTVYLLYVMGGFSFNGDSFDLNNREIMPVRLNFSKNEKEQYSLIEEAYIEDYGFLLFSRNRAYAFEKNSIKEHITPYIGQVFPKEEVYKAIYGDYENKLGMQLIEKARGYLKSINSDAKIRVSDYDGEFNISDDAKEKLYDISLIKSYPLYSDSCKRVENGKVYIYESKQEGDILIFTKYNVSRDKILERIKIKVDGDEVTVIEE